jgi:hypothetical protein
MTRPAEDMLFIKQYGERRTGTNFVRNLLSLNFEGIITLMHMLGDKHSPAVPLDSIWESALFTSDPSWQFVYEASFSAPSLTTDAKDAKLLDELARLAQPVTEAFLNRKLKYIICSKHPYAWLTSLSKYLGWSDWDKPVPVEYMSSILVQCERFNKSYRSWLLLLRKYPEDTMVVRHEDLIVSPISFLAEVERRFDVSMSSIHPIVPPGHILQAHWDYSSPGSFRERFDPSHYTERRYLRLITEELARTLNEIIDWSLMQEFGYTPLDIQEFSALSI